MRNVKTGWITLAAALTLLLPASAWADGSSNLHVKKLKNGLEVIVLEDHSVPLVTIEIAVKNGAFTEPPEFNGLSHLYEHMFFKANAVLPSQEAYLERIRELGIVFNGTTSDERVNYFFTMPSTNLAPGMVFMRDAITTPRFEQEEFTKEIQVVLGEVDRNESNPYYWLGQAVDKKLWSAHPTRKDSLGDRETITTATIEKMKTMQQRYYVPNNSALLIAGDVKPEEVFAMAEKLYAGWKPTKKDPHVQYPVPAHPALKETSIVVVTRPDVRIPYMQWSWHGPSVVKDPRATYAADVLSYILSQPTSQFHKALVDSGVTLGASLGYYTQKYTGPISASAQVRPDKLKDAVRALLTEIDKLAQPDYFTDEQLKNAKAILAIQAIYEQEKSSALIHTVSFWWATASLDYFKNYVTELNKITREDIAKFVSTYVQGKDFVFGLLISEADLKASGLDEAALKQIIDEVKAERSAANPKSK
jgi:zinc protease